MPDVLTRQLIASDEPEWLRMRIALWPENPAPQLQSEMREIAPSPERSPVFVAVRADGRIGGFLEANIRDCADGCDSRPVAYIEGWFVDADLRRLGIGKKLVQTAENWARSKGLKEIASDCLLDNDVSLRAHSALDYQETERLIHFCKSLG